MEAKIKDLALKYFDQVGFAKATRPLTMDYYDSWIKNGYHGNMEYLRRHQNRKSNPQSLLPGARTWITLALDYDTGEPLSLNIKEEMLREKKGWISRYARNGDYHKEIAKRHEMLVGELSLMFPGEKFLGCVDTKPVLERDVAQQSGLGWIGKNTCLINKDLGSFLFLSEILTTLLMVADNPVADHCGTCTKCLDSCPTGAFISPRHLDATKCISYWTIENETPPPLELAKKFGTNVFGCDICQDVCPWNSKSRRTRQLKTPGESSGILDLEKFSKMSDEDIQEFLDGTAMDRATPQHFRQNIEITLENLRRDSYEG